MIQTNVIQIVLAVTLTVSAQTATAQVPVAISTIDRSHAFIQHIEGIYAQSLKAEREGDVALFEKVRAKFAVEATYQNLKKMGKPTSELASLLKRSVAWQTDISEFRFVRADAKPHVARLLYQREGKDAQGLTVEFAVIMAHWDNGAWRIGWIANAPGPKMFMGKERTIDELTSSPRFGI